MRTAVLVLGGLTLACGVQAARSSRPATPPEVSDIDTTAGVEPNDDPLGEVEAFLTRVEMEHPTYRDWDVAATLQRVGMTESLAIRALAACVGPERASSRRCLYGEHTAMLVAWLAEFGTTRAANVLFAHDSAGLHRAGIALEATLLRRMIAEAGPCAPPTAAETERARESLVGFVVIDRARAGEFVARVPSERELDDLAYFMAAVEFAGPEVATQTPGFHSGLVPAARELEQRAAWLAEIHDASRLGDLVTVQSRGYAYIESLGYPDEIDLSREGEMTWGGARASQLMREVAFTSEIVGELEVASALYQRANPGGGMCGTSTGYRWQQQVQGFIRTRERAEGCRAVVAERLLDVDGDWDDASPYGPARLVDSGFDLARLYRGALLTRNRDLEASVLLAAIDRAPLATRATAQARWTSRGPEAWEARIRAIEGIADELGRAGVDLLLAQFDSFAPQLRARALSAVGDAAERLSIGPCDDDAAGLHGFRIGGDWERPVGVFGTTCAAQLDDAAAEALTKRVLPHVDDEDADIRAAAVEAIGDIASPRSLRRLRRVLARTDAELARCRARTPDECFDVERVRDAADDAVKRVGELLAAG